MQVIISIGMGLVVHADFRLGNNMAKSNLWFLFVERGYSQAVKNPKQYDARTEMVVRATVSGPFDSKRQAQTAAIKTTATSTCLSVLVLDFDELEMMYKSNHCGANNVSLKRVVDIFRTRRLREEESEEEDHTD